MSAKIGRPSKYSVALARRICERLASGMPLTKIVRIEGMPTMTTVYRWLAKNLIFRQMYVRAREDQADTLADEIVDLADQAIAGKEGNVDAVRLQVDARKWVAAKLKPRKYGDRVTTEHTGLDGGPIQHETIEPRPAMSPDAWLKAHGVDLGEIADGVGPAARAANERAAG